MTRYNRLKALNKCIRCGVNTPINGLKCLECTKRVKELVLKYTKEDPRRYNKYRNTFFQKIKDKAYKILGEVCSCCGESDRRFLTLDHINNDGYKDKKRRRNLTYLMYKEVVKDRIEGKYQILCWNCNCGKRSNRGICPHKEKI